MTATVRGASAGLAVVAVLTLGVTACGPSDSSSGGSTPASTAASAPASSAAAASSGASGQSTDLAKLVIQPSDIPIPGFTQKSSTPVSQGGATGIAVAFASGDGTRQLGDTIVTLPDATTAKTALDAATNTAKSQLKGVQTSTVQIGDGGTLLSGTQSGQSASVLVFQQGKAFVVMAFSSAANDPVPAEVVNAVGQKQAELLKSGLG